MNSEIVMYQTEDGLTKIETTFYFGVISRPFLVTLKIYLMKVN